MKSVGFEESVDEYKHRPSAVGNRPAMINTSQNTLQKNPTFKASDLFEGISALLNNPAVPFNCK